MRQIGKNSALYYPFLVPKTPWIKQSLLYWDEITSIIPEGLDKVIEDNYDIRLLEDQGIFTRMRPQNFEISPSEVDTLIDQFLRIINNQDFISFRQIFYRNELNESADSILLLHEDKLLYSIGAKMMERGYKFAYPPMNSEYGIDYAHGLLYLALLAKCIGNKKQCSPVTETGDFQKWLYEASYGTHQAKALSLLFTNILPTPHETTSLADIIKFKRDRRDILLDFRKIIEDFNLNISRALNDDEVSCLISSFKTHIERSLIDLHKAAKGTKVTFSFKSCITSLLSSAAASIAIAKQFDLNITCMAPIIAGINIVVNSIIVSPTSKTSPSTLPVSYLLEIDKADL